MSHAPEWAPDICELLNPESPNDWRILAGKLGHSEEDISLWSGLSDPCKFLLDEWFINHKTLQATKDVLEKLREMKRNDAADIVEKALKAVGMSLNFLPFYITCNDMHCDKATQKIIFNFLVCFSF